MTLGLNDQLKSSKSLMLEPVVLVPVMGCADNTDDVSFTIDNKPNREEKNKSYFYCIAPVEQI